MYYWHVIFWNHGLRYEQWLWNDSYEGVKVQVKLTYGSSTSFEKIERVNNG